MKTPLFRQHHVSMRLLALIVLIASPMAMARGHVSVGISVPGIGISYSDYGRHGHGWGGHLGGYWPSHGYYGYAPRPVYYDYRPYHRERYRAPYYAPQVVYYDRGGYRDRPRYRDDRYRDGHYDRRHDRRDDYRHRDRRGGYYDRSD